MVEVKEAYKKYKSPFDVSGVIKILPSHAPKNHLSSLKTIILTNLASFSYSRK